MASMSSSSKKDPQTPPSTMPVARVGGKEELRANLLKPYLLRLRSVKDDAAVRALMSVAGIPLSVIDDETGWISVAAGRRALDGDRRSARRGGAHAARHLAHPSGKPRHLRPDAPHRGQAGRRVPLPRAVPRAGEPRRRVRADRDHAAFRADDLPPAGRFRERAAPPRSSATRAKGSSRACPTSGVNPTRPSSTKRASRRATTPARTS